MNDSSHIQEWRQTIASVREKDGDRAFLNWSGFDEFRDLDTAHLRGAWDFSCQVLSPLAPFLTVPEDRDILEIGYGGGRLLGAAARHFRTAIGLDVHPCGAVVKRHLAERGARNLLLLQGDGSSIPLRDATMDCAYSFIVLQHLAHLSLLTAYFRETFRVLRPGGVALLYFGRYSWHW